nr:MAG TPA: hypothetical protein [Caudoviricetes sp.]
MTYCLTCDTIIVVPRFDRFSASAGWIHTQVACL